MDMSLMIHRASESDIRPHIWLHRRHITMTPYSSATPLADLVLDAQAALGEGPLWDAVTKRLYWVDILDGRLHWYDPATGRDASANVGSHVGTVVTRASGGVMLALQDGFYAFDPATPATPPTCIAKSPNHRPGLRFTDGKCDPAGRFWAGTYDDAPGVGSLWRLDADHAVRLMIPDVSCSNGLVWDLGRERFYFIDSPTRAIVAYDYEHGPGTISRPRVAVQATPDDGYPDGMAIDVEGKLWVAHWGAGMVVRWDPETGKAITRIRVPATQPSACAFAGERMDRLYITSARSGLSAETLAAEPHSGGLFVVDPGVSGVGFAAYAG